jgi:hypothetical protein
MHRHSLHRQRGAAALIVTLVLFFVMTMMAAFANRNHVFEQRASANQVRATQAFEAAEAGIEWAIAMLNDPRAIDANCVATDDAAGQSFRERHLTANAATGAQTPSTWVHDGKVLALQAACARSAAGWACSCPSNAAPSLPPPPANAAAPAFAIRFAAAAQPGVIQLQATGCSNPASTCLGAEAGPTEGTARMQVLLGLVPGYVTPPAAPLTVKGSVEAPAAALGLHNADAATGGATLHAGASFHAPHARLHAAAGGAGGASAIEGDDSLLSMTNDRLFASFFGIDKGLWKDQPGVAHVACQDDCAAVLSQAIGQATTHRLIWVDGDLQIDGPLALGSAQRPVVIVASGAAHFHGAVTMHGVLHATSLQWSDAAAGTATLRGAAIVEGDYTGNGEPDFAYDAAVLAALKTGTGSFARVAGSWKDF